MNEDFLSIADAAARFERSHDSIRRLIKSLIQEDADAPHVQQEQLANGSTKYYISATWLKNHLANPPMQSTLRTNLAPGAKRQVNDDNSLLAVIQILRGQLEAKDKQIANFQERDREHNVLLRDLQQHLLLLEAPRTPEPEQTPITEPAPAPEPERGWLWQRKRRRFGK